MGKDTHSPSVVGGSSLLVIFAVLCLTIFALLSLTTIQANGRLAAAATLAVTDYYQADGQAETILAQLRSGQHPAGVVQEGNRYTYSCPISATQALEVEVLLDGTDYTILRWQSASTGFHEGEDTLSLWDGAHLS